MGLGLGLTTKPPHEARAGSEGRRCVIIDNDFDIDDMMSIPLVIGNSHVAAIVLTEGASLPGQAAPVVEYAFNPKVPVIVGGSPAQSPDLSRWPWLPFWRSMMSVGNGLLKSAPSPWPSDAQYPERVAAAVKGCRSVTVLVLGPYSSLVNYLPLIASKVDRVVAAVIKKFDTFNCGFDLDSCQAAVPMLKRLSTYFVSIPSNASCFDTLTPPPSCYSPDFAMVDGLTSRGLSGRMREALLNNISCAQYYSVPATLGRPCSSRSTWNPPDIAIGPGGPMLLWDQSTSLFLLRPQVFSLYPETGGLQHYEPTLVNGSDAKTVQKLRALWTSLMNDGSM